MALLVALLTALGLAAPAAVPYPTDVTLPTADGKTVVVSVGVPAKVGNGVVLVHMAGRTKEDWQAQADKLYRSGLAVAAVDLRGHGANVTGTPPTLTGTDWLAMVEDVKAGVAELKKRGAQKVALVGAEVGANLALVTAAADPGIASVVMLSPGLDYKGVLTGEAVKRYGARPLLLVASKDDAYGARSATTLEGLAAGPKTLTLFEAAGKGNKMFNREPGLEGQILGFLATSWTAAPPPSTPATVDVKVQSKEMETSGPRIGEGTSPPPQ